MNSLMQVQQDMLGRMEQIKTLSEGAVIKPAQLFEAQPPQGFAVAFDNVLRAVDDQQHQAGAAAAA